MTKILMILTSHSQLDNTDSTTGLWIGEFTDPYYEFIDKGYAVTLTSPAGGPPPIDPMSQLTENITTSNRRFKDDQAARAALNSTLPLAEINPDNFDALFFPGGHGPLWDLATNEICGQLIVDFLTKGKPVAAVCHGPAALISAAKIDPAILQGKKVTGFSNTEEVLALRNNNIPYKLEDRLKELGADYHKNLIPFMVHLEEEGLLITGQNPLSAGPAAKALIKRFEQAQN